MNEIDDLNESLCEDNELTIDGEWMDKLATVSNRRATVQSLLAKAEQNSEDIKEAIFMRVQHDYEQRLALIEQEFQPIAMHVGQELTQVQTRERSIRSRLELIEDLIEEKIFRCKVGEYPEAELNEKIGLLGSMKNRLDDQLEIVKCTYGDCEKFLGDDWRDQESGANRTESLAALKLEQALEEATEGQVEVKPVVDPAGLVWADLGTPVAPDAQSEPTGKWDAADLELALEQPVESIACAPVSAEQASVRAELEACLQMVNPKGEAELFEFGAEGISIGKSTDNDVVIKKAGVSRRHARVVLRKPGEYHVQDLSGAGIAVNGLVTEQAVLHSGDTITVGKIDFELITRD